MFAQSSGFGSGPVLLFVVGLVAVVVVGYLGYRAKQQRILGFQALARAHGLTYETGDDGLLSLPFALFSAGDRRGVENVLRGRFEEADLVLFDYWYEVSTTDAQGRTSTSTSTFDCVTSTYGASGPRLSIAEENVLTRLADALAMDDMRFGSDTFNDAFNVKGDDQRFATAFIDARMMEWLLAHGRGLAFEVAGDRLLVTHRRVAVDEIPGLLSTAAAFVAQIPRVVASLYPKSG